MNLLQQIADEGNLESSFYSCLQGKRTAYSPQLTFLKLDSLIVSTKEKILSGEKYPWGNYREFYVCDPKRRLISSAPFIDRVVHRAIYNILEPKLDQYLIPNTYACRSGKGNGRAVMKLFSMINEIDDYYAIKIDVKKFFSSIQHGRLLGKISSVIKDDSIFDLIRGLLFSHPIHRNGVGLPLGNLTSQIFANYYLKDIDDYLYLKSAGYYIRYMDDLIFLSKSKREISEMLSGVLDMAQKEKIIFPNKKRVWLKNAPMPFLGFLISKEAVVPLNKNQRKLERNINEKIKNDVLMSELYQSRVSYEAWKEYPKRVVC